MRLLTYNIHKCAAGVERVAGVIASLGPDVALLQEVAETQAERLAVLTGLGHEAYYGHVERFDGLRYGNAVLSRWPIDHVMHVDLTVPFKKRRSALHARLQIPVDGRRRAVHVFNMHLGLSGLERRVQLRRFLEGHPFAHLHAATPIVVGGDLNDVWGTLGRALLGPAGFRGAPRRQPTFPAFAPLRALDGLFVRGDLRVERCRVARGSRASDHLPVIMDVTLTEPLRNGVCVASGVYKEGEPEGL